MMAYRTIVTLLTEEDGAKQRLGLVKALAARFEAEVEALHVSLPAFMTAALGDGAAYVGPEFYEAQQARAAELTERMKQLYRDVLEPLTVPARWRHEEGDPPTVTARLARTADLVVMGQIPTSRIDVLGPSPVEEVVLDSGTPVLVLPPGWTDAGLGRQVLVGWNGSREAGRALRDALPFLERAEGVTIATIGESRSVHDVLALLRSHRIEAEVVAREATREVGKALLDLAMERKADLMVLGAYGHSRLREVVLGGTTRDALGDATIPVLFSC
jgi:nucleotide-binding universal stress UspA family protein